LEPFQVVCSNCRAKIRVRSPRKLGQQVPCPRCQHPLLLQPGGQVKVPPQVGGMAADSQALTQEASLLLSSELQASPSPSAAPAPNEPRTVAEGRDGAWSEDDTNANNTTTARPPRPSDSLTPDFEPVLEPEPDVLTPPPPSWTNHNRLNHRPRQILIVSLLGIGGVGLCLGLFLAFLRWVSDSPQLAERNRETSAAQEPSPADSEPSPADSEPSPADSQEPAAGDNQLTANDGEPGSGGEEPAAGDKEPAAGGEEPERGAEEPRTEREAADGPTGAATESATPAAPAPAFDPRFLPIFDPSRLVGGLSDSRTVSTDVPEIGQVQLEPVDIGQPSHPPSAAAGDWDQLMQSQLPKMQVSQQPLARLLGDLSQLTGVGIAWDWWGVAAAGLSPETPIDLRADPQPFGELMLTLLEPLGLELVPDAFNLPRLTAKRSFAQQRLTPGLTLEGLAEGEDELQRLEQLLIDLMPEATAGLSRAMTRLSWANPPEPSEQFRLFRLIQLLRATRQLPALGDYPPGTFTLESQFAQPPTLERFATGRPIKPQSITGLLERAADEAGLRLIVDWPAVWKHGLTPSQRGLTLLHDRNLAEVAWPFLDRFALQLIPLDQRTLWLTTYVGHRTAAVELVLPISGQIELSEQLESLFPFTPVDSELYSRLELVRVLDSPWAIARVCRPGIEQQWPTQLPQTSGAAGR
jgi:DNA-directed RNA polymerase subunit RPC12/RpoP